MTELRQDFLQGMSFVAATVNVVTTDGPAGRSGVTVSAMSSVSADTERPTLLVCVNEASSGAAPIIENGLFCVNILRDDQSFISDTFAGRYGDKGEDKFRCARWDTMATGAPILENALAAFDCRLVRDKIVGTHHVFFGEVEAVRLADSGRALVYSNRAYSTPLKLPDAAFKKSAGQFEKETVRLVCLNSFGPFFLPGLLSEIQAAEPDFVVEVLEGDQAEAIDAIAGQDAEFGLVYDRHLPDYLANTKLATLEPYVLLPEGHLLASNENVALAALADEPMVLLDAPLSREYFLSLFEDAQLEPRIGMKTTSFEMVRSLVGNGAGYALLVTKPANMVSYDGRPLVARPIADDVAPIAIVLAQRAGEPMSEGAERAVAHCIRYFGEA